MYTLHTHAHILYSCPYTHTPHTCTHSYPPPPTHTYTHSQSAAAGGLCGEEAGAKNNEIEDLTNAAPNSVPLVAPLDLEDRSAFTSSGSRPMFSRLSRLTNSILKPGVGGVARSGSMAGSPNTQRKMNTEFTAISENE